MTSPPRMLESVLMSLGASAEYRDVVIGDLAEELAVRSVRDGATAARDWYYREAVRSIPHLIANGVRAMGRSDVTRVAGIVATAWVLVVMSAGVGLMILFSTVIRFWPEHQWIVRTGPVALSLAVVVIASSAFAGGYTAARLDRRSPLVSAAALGLAWAMTEIVLLVIGRVGSATMLFPLVVPPLLLISAVVGGLMRVRSAWHSTSTDATYWRESEFRGAPSFRAPLGMTVLSRSVIRSTKASSGTRRDPPSAAASGSGPASRSGSPRP